MIATTYLDQNALIRLGQKARDAEFRKKLDSAITSGSFCPVVSSWHLIETAHTKSIANAVELADFIDSLRPAWLHERRDLQKMDVEEDFCRFVKIGHPSRSRLTTKSAVIATLNGAADAPRFDIPSRDFVGQWLRHPDQMKPVEETLQKSAEVLIALREATKSGKLTQAIRRRADELMVSLSLPTTTPSGLHYGRDVKGEYLAQLDSTKIPSIAIETAISDNEWGEEFVGKTDRNTFIDKVHLIAALPFVDEIVSDDKFFGAIYPVAVTTGHVKAKLINVDQLLKRIEEVEVKPPPEMPCQSGSEENNSCA